MNKDAEQNLQAILESPSYRLAEADIDFLRREALRPLRMELELLKPEMMLDEQGVDSTIVVFGGTQIVDPEAARDRVAAARTALEASPGDRALKRRLARAERIAAKSRFYDDAREFGRLVSTACQREGKCEYLIVTGGGPGIMEAANRGAFEVGAKSAGLNITLPHEQTPNAYITPELCFLFHYFAMRKFHFLLRAEALVVFPGGFGTLDELFNTLTLRQTGRMQEIPIVLFGQEYWEQIIYFQRLADEGVIADDHLELIQYADTAQDAWQTIQSFHADHPQQSHLDRD